MPSPEDHVASETDHDRLKICTLALRSGSGTSWSRNEMKQSIANGDEEQTAATDDDDDDDEREEEEEEIDREESTKV